NFSEGDAHKRVLSLVSCYLFLIPKAHGWHSVGCRCPEVPASHSTPTVGFGSKCPTTLTHFLIRGSSGSIPRISKAPTPYGTQRAGWAQTNVGPRPPPNTPASAEADWLPPSTSRCRSGSLRREIRAWADGVRKAKPMTATVRLTSTPTSKVP